MRVIVCEQPLAGVTLSSKPRPIKDYFPKLQMLLRKHNFLPHNISNMDGKGLLLEMSNRAKVIIRRGRGELGAPRSGTHLVRAAVEVYSTNNLNRTGKY